MMMVFGPLSLARMVVLSPPAAMMERRECRLEHPLRVLFRRPSTTAAEAAARAIVDGRRRRRRRGARGLLRRVRRHSEPTRFDALEAFRRSYVATVKANAAANVVRNVWSNAIIFCGHFPRSDIRVHRTRRSATSSPGGRYVRQLIGAANIEGGPVLPRDQRQPGLPGRAPPLPRHAVEPLRGDRAAGARHLPPLRTSRTTRGRSSKQWGTVQRTIARLAFPGGKARPKPGDRGAARRSSARASVSWLPRPMWSASTRRSASPSRPSSRSSRFCSRCP